jgi:hypothetical protein
VFDIGSVKVDWCVISADKSPGEYCDVRFDTGEIRTHAIEVTYIFTIPFDWKKDIEKVKIHKTARGKLYRTKIYDSYFGFKFLLRAQCSQQCVARGLLGVLQ